MASGVSGIGGYSYLGRLRQAQGEQKNSLFGKVDTNADNSISRDEWTALQSGLTAQSQNVKSSSSGSASSLLSLLQNAAVSGTTSNSASSATAANASFAKIDTDGDGSLTTNELNAFQAGLTTQLLNGTTTSGSTASDDTSNGTSSISTAAAFMQQAISKYMQFTPTGKGIAAVGSLLGLG